MKFKLIIFLCSLFYNFNNYCMAFKDATQAIYDGNITLVLQFLKEGNSVNSSDAFGYTLLHLAAASGEKEIVEMLIQKGANVKTTSLSRLTPLHSAVISKYPEIIRLLLRNGADPNIADSNGETPLHSLFPFSDEIASAKLLLEYKADPRIRDRFGNKPEFYARTQEFKNLLNAEEQKRNAQDSEKKIASPESGNES